MKQNIIRYLEYNRNNFTESEKHIADFFIKKRDLDNLKITEVSKSLFISTATVSRFVNKIGYKNYKEFIYEFENSLEELANMAEDDKYIVDSLWEIQKNLYKEIYDSIGKIDLKFIANKLLNCQEAFFYCFGDMQHLLDVFTERIRPIIPESHVIKYYEHLVHKLSTELNYHNLLVIFYQNNLYKDQMHDIITFSKKKFVPVIIISISEDVETLNYAFQYTLFPKGKTNENSHSIVSFMPMLVFTEALYNAIKIKLERKNKIYSGYF